MMRPLLLKIFWLALAVVTTAHAGNVAAQNSGDKFAVVVGIEQYRHLPPLDYPVADAKRLAQQFESMGYSVLLLENYAADPQHILDTMHKVGGLMDASGGRENGTLVFAFSGHGFQQDGQNFLATGHAVSANLRQTALSLDRIKKVLEHSRIARQVMFIDACRNDPGKSGVDPLQRFVKDESAEGLAVMYSTGAGELSWEDSELGQGVFSYYLAKGLSGAAANNHQITYNSLYRYVSKQVAQHVLKRFDRRQIPYTAGERNGDFILGSTEKPATTGGWRKLLSLAGVVVLTAVIASAASSASGSDNEAPVTLVVPTP